MNASRGFTLVSAIFLLVVLAVLGAAAVTVSTTQHMGSAQDIQGSRAYHAARAGIEWGLYQVLRHAAFETNQTNASTSAANAFPAGSACASVDPAAPTTFSFAFPASAATLAGFGVTVTCFATHGANNDANYGPWVYTLEATACHPPAVGNACPGDSSLPGYVERRLRVTF